MRKLRDIVLQQQPLIMNEAASVQAACERMRDTQAGSVLITNDTGRLGSKPNNSIATRFGC